MENLLTHDGILLFSDYLTVFFAFIVTILLQVSSIQKQLGEKFKMKILIHENWVRWLLSLNSALFLLYVLPDAYFYYMEEFTSTNEPGTTTWNISLSAIIGLSPLYILNKVIKISRSKLRDNE